MPHGNFFIVMLLIWTFVGRGVDGENVTGVLHGRVELRGHCVHRPDVNTVEWTKYLSRNSIEILIYKVNKTNMILCPDPCQNIDFNFQNMSLILVHLTSEDEGIYKEKITFTNGTTKCFKVTLSLLSASKISVSPSPGSLILKCEITGQFELLRWFRDGRPLPDDQRFSLTENNKTLRVFNLNSSDCTTYTCQVSNENEKSEAHVNFAGEMPDICLDNTFFAFIKGSLFPVGLSLICLLVLGLILICVCKLLGYREIKNTSIPEPVYDEPICLQEEAATPTASPLQIVYQDFIRPNDLQKSEDFGYSTIADVLANEQPSQTTCASNCRCEP